MGAVTCRVCGVDIERRVVGGLVVWRHRRTNFYDHNAVEAPRAAADAGSSRTVQQQLRSPGLGAISNPATD